MSVFSANIHHRSFYWQISMLCFVLGLLMAAAVHTATQITRLGVGPSREGFVYGGGAVVATSKITQDESEIKKLRERESDLENKVAEGTGASATLNQELQDTNRFAGLTDVAGPGVQVTLTDSQKRLLLPSDQAQLSSLIHDSDIANVVNELKAAGAEALSVNGQRIVVTTAIRCVGPVVHVNGIPTAPPYTVLAVGDPNVMLAALNMPGGVLDQLRQFDPSMVRADRKVSLRIPAFDGSTQMRFGHVPTQNSRDR